jgi:putative salt-induced outer membrane protein YdiY
MKKILMLSAFALAGLAAAQDTTTPAPTETAPATTETAPMTDPAMTTEAAPEMTTMTMTPADAFARAQEYAVQADVAYPVPFYDRTLWKAAVDASYVAASQDTSNRAYDAYLAQLYTKTQWWINAYNAWNNLGELNDTEKEWASLSAAKLAYIALQRGDRTTARAYVEKGMSWKDSASLQAIMSRL